MRLPLPVTQHLLHQRPNGRVHFAARVAVVFRRLRPVAMLLHAHRILQNHATTAVDIRAHSVCAKLRTLSRLAVFLREELPVVLPVIIQRTQRIQCRRKDHRPVAVYLRVKVPLALQIHQHHEAVRHRLPRRKENRRFVPHVSYKCGVSSWTIPTLKRSRSSLL